MKGLAVRHLKCGWRASTVPARSLCARLNLDWRRPEAVCEASQCLIIGAHECRCG